MEAILPLMENASALDWLTLGGLAYLAYRDFLQKKRIDEIKEDLTKHEDHCIAFRKEMYNRVGAVENQVGILNERTAPKPEV